MAANINQDIAGQLDEVARILNEQGANRFRVQAYQRAAETLRHLSRPVSELYAEEGPDGLRRLPGVGESLARSLRDILDHGKLAMLERLRGESDPIALLCSVPGIGKALARKLHADLEIETLEELETAAHDGRLETLAGVGGKRLAGIRDSLAQRLGRVRRPPSVPAEQEPPIGELLGVDEEYRRKAASGALKQIAPRRFNPTGEAWLPVLHTARGPRHYTALFSNTAHAHQRHKTHDWVVLYYEDGQGEHQCTVVTAEVGPLRGQRIIRGREAQCLEYSRRASQPATQELKDAA